MDKFMEDLIEDLFEIKIEKEYHFRKLYGLTFAFKQEIAYLNNKISSADIRPVGIIYEENDQYCLAPLYDAIEIEEVVREFVWKNLKK